MLAHAKTIGGIRLRDEPPQSRELGNPESDDSCSHGASHRVSRNTLSARSRWMTGSHRWRQAGVEIRMDRPRHPGDPGAYQPIDAVVRAESDLLGL